MGEKFSCDPAQSRGRRFAEDSSTFRSCFQRDRDRIVHCSAFRRLKHKTQVFLEHEGDYFRTRLTHSIEVAQVARTIAGVLGLNAELTETVALAHDLGHPPFGHTGEEALDALMAPFGGFDHNAQAVSIVTNLERHYAQFDGLNLTWESLEGVAKHNGPIAGQFVQGRVKTPSIFALDAAFHLELETYAGPEAQVAAIADDIAYNNHDLDDGLRAGIFSIGDLGHVPHVAEAFAEVRSEFPAIEETKIVHEAVRRLIGDMVEDVVVETGNRIAAAKPISVAEIRHLGYPVVAFSTAMGEKERVLKGFLFDRMYRHETVVSETDRARDIGRYLFERFMDKPNLLPDPWCRFAEGPNTQQTARIVCDYVAGMTDQFALRLHRRISEGMH